MGKRDTDAMLAVCRTISKHVCSVGYRGRMLIHAVGLSAIGASLVLEVLVFWQILGKGFFMGVEGNFAVLAIEVMLVAIAVLYYCYLSMRVLLSRAR